MSWEEAYSVHVNTRDQDESGCRPCDTCHQWCPPLHPHVEYRGVMSGGYPLSTSYTKGYCSEACALTDIGKRGSRPLTASELAIIARWKDEEELELVGGAALKGDDSA